MNEDFTEKGPVKGDYEDCRFVNCNFSGTDLSGVNFIESEFTNCNLSNVKVRRCLFQEAVFNNCKMLGIGFDECNEFGFTVRFENCQLDHSSFYGMKLNRSTFRSCRLQGAFFTDADLGKTSLLKCDLKDASFEHTNLEKADLRESFNYSIDPEINRIRGARFSIPEVIGLLDKYGLKIDGEE